jgi:N6-adenosine-specific RNA methylase IME4
MEQNKKYKTILADPPWDIGEMRMKKSRPNAELPYPRMKTQAIKDLDVKSLADENCNLFLWTTHTFLPDAFEVIKSWGFKYHCLLTWDKTNGIPCWGFKRKTEFVLYGYRGKITVNQTGKFIHTLFTEKLTTHSKKPNIFYEILESNTPEPRIELFARNKRNGWDTWGNELQNDIEL